MQLPGLQTADEHARSVQDNHARAALYDEDRKQWNEGVALSQARDEALLAIAASVDRQAAAMERLATALEAVMIGLAEQEPG